MCMTHGSRVHSMNKYEFVWITQYHTRAKAVNVLCISFVTLSSYDLRSHLNLCVRLGRSVALAHAHCEFVVV